MLEKLRRNIVILVSFFKQLFLRSKEAVFWLATFPTILFLILVSVFGNIEENVTLRVRVLGESELLKRAFGTVELVDLKFLPPESIDEALAELESDKLDAVVEIPKDFDGLYARGLLLKRTLLFKPIDVRVHYVPVRENSRVAFEVVKGVFEALDLPENVQVEVHNLTDVVFDYESFILAGVVGMALLSTFLFGFLNDIIWLRRGRMFRNFSVRPVSMVKIYVMALLVNIVALAIGLSLLQVVASLMGVDTVGYLPGLLWNTLVSVITLATLTIAFATFGRRANALVIFQQVFFQVQMFLGGYYFPIRQMPQTLQLIARILPLTYPVDAMRVHLGFNSIEGNHYIVPLVYALVSAVVIVLRRNELYRSEGD